MFPVASAGKTNVCVEHVCVCSQYCVTDRKSPSLWMGQNECVVAPDVPDRTSCLTWDLSLYERYRFCNMSW